MAGSGFPPLPNIPYCCLPQESGPCLSTSVGDRPLRSPTHRSLGGPSPRLPANGTHARPVPPVGFADRGMPPGRRMADCPAFPPAIRPRGVGCIRVAHPSATLVPPKGHLPFDLHVLGLPLAFILSQDQTLRCTIVFIPLFSESPVPPSLFLVSRFLLPASAHASRRLLGGASCAGLKLSKNFRKNSPLFRPLFPSFAGCKNTTFYLPLNQLFSLFFENIRKKLVVSLKNIH